MVPSNASIKPAPYFFVNETMICYCCTFNTWQR